MTGSEIGPWTEAVSVQRSPASLPDPHSDLARLRLTTLVFFFRPVYDLDLVPEPSASPVVAELRLTIDGREGR